ncbi:hypothetical protein M434DRAFT_400719 [Hypoxylon sp. CO27-5]|nr:hypothetical protein M434DRAFT_400719 [Hypoxylon sp. CO27-5]
MDLPIASNAEGSVEKFLDIPYEQRWEPLKSTIIHIYMEENNKIAPLAERMKDEYSFDAQVHQYRYHFKKWGIKKRINAEEKGAIISALGKRRLHKGTSTSDATLDQGDFRKAVDKKQLKRHIDQSIRQSAPLTLTPGVFLRYDLPYAALVRSLGGYDHSSPASAGPATPAYLTVTSPQEVTSPLASHNALSPTMQLVQRKVLLDRARLFLEGRYQELMAQMGRDERKSTATWLHDFWIYSFMTAKYWGRGPKTWSFSLINFKSFSGEPVPSTPDHSIDNEHSSSHLSPQATIPNPNSPTQLCRWSIHYKELKYEELPFHPPNHFDESEEQYDIDDESTWTKWPRLDQDLATTLTQGFQQNIFTKIQPEKLPLAANSIANAIEKSPDEMQAEAFGFAIMSRNLDIIYEMIEEYDGKLPEAMLAIYPFHLAAKFLDGAKACCLIMDSLAEGLQDSSSIGVNYVDSSGHTVLDTLLITIMRSHSTVPFQALREGFSDQTRYPGQEVDPCGRWDADSPCIRRLFASGNSSIPLQWKHMFCHTSIQAVCHSISAMFFLPQRPNINTLSGLFMRRCGHCGLELKLGPLHALVLVAFHLASNGMPGENLFGMVSCLVCLLTLRADPCVAVEVSVPALIGRSTIDECQHQRMNPAELATQLILRKVEPWAREVELGWKVLVAILQQDIRHREIKDAQGTEAFSDGDINVNEYFEDDNTSTYSHIIHEIEIENGVSLVYCGNRQLGKIWAAIQAELLTYRRLNEGGSWLSRRFDMELLLKGLQENDDKCLNQLADGVGDVGEGRLEAYSHCGLFDTSHPGCARREEVCTDYYANLDDWGRTTFIRALPLDMW